MGLVSRTLLWIRFSFSRSFRLSVSVPRLVISLHRFVCLVSPFSSKNSIIWMLGILITCEILNVSTLPIV